jgi:hypothetical protein
MLCELFLRKVYGKQSLESWFLEFLDPLLQLNEGSWSFSLKSFNIAEWMIFFKIGCCLSGLGIVRKNRRIPKSYL